MVIVDEYIIATSTPLNTPTYTCSEMLNINSTIKGYLIYIVIMSQGVSYLYQVNLLQDQRDMVQGLVWQISNSLS